MLATHSSPKLPLPAPVYPDTHTFPPVTPLTHSHVYNSTHRMDTHTQIYAHSDAATPAFPLTNTLLPLPTHLCTQTHIDPGEGAWRDSHACLWQKWVREKPPSLGRANFLTHSVQPPHRAPGSWRPAQDLEASLLCAALIPWPSNNAAAKACPQV